MRICNPVSKFSLTWSQVRGFRIGRHGFFGASLLIDTVDGATRYSFAVRVANVSLRIPRAPERMIVHGPNEMLAQYQPTDGPAAQGA